MNHLLELKKLQVKELVESFVAKTLCQQPSKKMCFAVCYPLSLYLKYNGIENTIRNGYYSGIPHYWLNLEDEKDTIIDPTVRQFDKKAEYVFIGMKNQNYDEKQFNFDETYDLWRVRYLERDFPPEFDINVFLTITKNAAVILENEYEQKRNFKEIPELGKYFEFVSVL